MLDGRAERSFTGGGCFLYTPDELSDIDDEDADVRVCLRRFTSMKLVVLRLTVLLVLQALPFVMCGCGVWAVQGVTSSSFRGSNRPYRDSLPDHSPTPRDGSAAGSTSSRCPEGTCSFTPGACFTAVRA